MTISWGSAWEVTSSGGLPYRFRQMRCYLREFENPLVLLRRGAAKRAEALTD
jgi:hypothetical protein